MVNIERMSVFSGGYYRKDVCILRWLVKTGCLYSQVVNIEKMSVFAGG